MYLTILDYSSGKIIIRKYDDTTQDVEELIETLCCSNDSYYMATDELNIDIDTSEQ